MAKCPDAPGKCGACRGLYLSREECPVERRKKWNRLKKKRNFTTGTFSFPRIVLKYQIRPQKCVSLSEFVVVVSVVVASPD